jgi:hypothetical protein
MLWGILSHIKARMDPDLEVEEEIRVGRCGRGSGGY